MRGLAVVYGGLDLLTWPLDNPKAKAIEVIVAAICSKSGSSSGSSSDEDPGSDDVDSTS